MERRDFLLTTATAAAASFAPGMSMEAKAEAVEAMAIESLDARAREQLEADVGVARPWLAYPELPQPHPITTISGKPANPSAQRMMMGDDPRLPPMPDQPTLVDFFRQRWLPASHLLQSANLALKNGHDEKVILACLLHDVSNGALVRTDHGYWGGNWSSLMWTRKSVGPSAPIRRFVFSPMSLWVMNIPSPTSACSVRTTPRATTFYAPTKRPKTTNTT